METCMSAIPVVPANSHAMPRCFPVPAESSKNDEPVVIGASVWRMAPQKPLDLPVAPTSGTPAEAILHFKGNPRAIGQQEGAVDQLVLEAVYRAESKLLAVGQEQAKHLGFELACRIRSASVHILWRP